MVQAARSGKQNIIEGSKVSGTSKEMEMKLLGVPRASLEELLGDYCDFLRVRALPIWEKESRQARFVRRLGTKADLSYADYWEFGETRPAAVVANIAVCQFTKPTSFWTGKSAGSSGILFKRAGSANV